MATDPTQPLMVVQDEWVGTACYFCYGQCANFGVQGVASEDGVQVRPCSRGFSITVARRRRRANRAPRIESPVSLESEQQLDASASDHS